MKKNTLAAIVLSMIVIVGSTYLQTKFYPAEPEAPAPSTEKPVTEAPQNTFIADTALEEAEPLVVDIPESAPVSEKTIEIETDLVRVTFTNRGGDILSYRLLKHAASNSTNKVEMIKNIDAKNRAFSIAFGDETASSIDQFFHVKQEKKDGKQIVGFYKDIMIRNTDGSKSKITLAKKYTFLPDDYMFDLQISIIGDENMKGLNFQNAGYTLRTAPQIGPEWDIKQDKYEYRNFISFVKGKAKTTKLKANKTESLTEEASWTSVAGKYFTMIVIPQSPIHSMVFKTDQQGSNEVQNSQIFIKRDVITKKAVNDVYRIYMGPCSERFLSKYNIPGNNPYGLDNVRIDSVASTGGILWPLEWVLKILLQFFNSLVKNWGVSIILVTVFTRIILFPLTAKSSKATQRMQELQPQIQAIQAKFKGKPQKLNEEMAKFYKEAGYNPLSGCLPMLVQFPLLFAMFRLFNNYFEFRGAMFIPGWIPDLSVGDSIYHLSTSIPFLGWTDLRILPIIYVISQLIFGKITQTPGAAPQQNSTMKIMLYGMPLFFFFIFYNAPSGLILYWTCSNFLMMVQQMIIKRTMHKKKEVQK